MASPRVRLALGGGRDMNSAPPLYLGIDIGTQGVRAVLATDDGSVIARASEPLPVPTPGPEQEQSPTDWWAAVVAATRSLGPARRAAVSIAISCTSGSVCAVDGHGEPVGPGFLYADARSVAVEGADSSWAIAKIAWLVADRPDIAERAALFTSPGGFVASRLLGRTAAVDVTQALKFGRDLSNDQWRTDVPVTVDRLPPVVRTGTVLGTVDRRVAELLGVTPTTTVVAGATDGIAGQIACRPTPDRWAVAIGSTIVWKAMSTRRIDSGGIYSHRGPDSWWFPGTASNAGARVLSSWASPADLERFARTVDITRLEHADYPLPGVGERFPFADATFTPWPTAATTPSERYAAQMFGIAFVERWGCDVMVEQGCPAPTSIATTGGVVASEAFTQVRSDVLQLPIEVPAEPSSAFGAAVIAAAPLLGGLLAAAAAMVQTGARFDPDTRHAAQWDDSFGEFREKCLRPPERRPSTPNEAPLDTPREQTR